MSLWELSGSCYGVSLWEGEWALGWSEFVGVSWDEVSLWEGRVSLWDGVSLWEDGGSWDGVSLWLGLGME